LDSEDREYLQMVVDGRLSKYHSENITRFSGIETLLAEIRSRLIGIDGNGTGKVGALQRQDKVLAAQNDKLEQMQVSQDKLETKLENFITQDETWDKKKVWAGVVKMLRIILVILALILSYLMYRLASHPQGGVARNPAISQNHTTDALTD
jgi:hypothetical protein